MESNYTGVGRDEIFRVQTKSKNRKDYAVAVNLEKELTLDGEKRSNTTGKKTHKLAKQHFEL